MTSPTFDLQPMSTGDILDRAVRLYRRHFLHTLAIVSLPYFLIVPAWALLGSGFAGRGRVGAFPNPALIAGASVFGLAYLWLYFVSLGAMARSVSERFLGGTPTMWAAYSPVLRRSLSLIWAYILVALAGGAVLSVGVGMFAGAFAVARRFPTIGGYAAAAVLGIAAIVAIAFAVRIIFRSFLITPVVVIEDVRGWGAFRRSWTLMRPSARKAGLILLFGFVVAFLISFLVNFPARMVMGFSRGWPAVVLSKVLESIGQILSAPFMMIPFTLLYYDSRIRQEAFDLEMMAKNLGVSAGPTLPSMSMTRTRPAPPSPSAPATPQVRPTDPPRLFGAFKVCPKCGAQVPNIQPHCSKCGTRVPFRPPTG
jgi:hypothetical protein